MNTKPKTLLQTTLELFSSNDSIYRNATTNTTNNNNITSYQINQTSPNINPPLLSSSSRQDNTSNQEDNYDHYHNIINQMNKDIKLINQKLSNIETSGLSSSRLTSDPDFLISSRYPKDNESNFNIASESERNHKTQYENALINKIKKEYETSIASKNAKMEELEKHNKLLLEKQHKLEQQIQTIEENTKTTTTQTNIETETEPQTIRPYSNKKYLKNDNKKKTISNTSKRKYVSNKKTTNIKEISQKKKNIKENNKNINKKGVTLREKKKEEKKESVKEEYDYGVYINKLKEMICGQEYLNSENLLGLIGMIEKTTKMKIEEMKNKHKEEMMKYLEMIKQLKEENDVLKKKVNKIKEIAE